MIKLMKESDTNENKKAFYRMMNAVQGRIAKKYGVETETHEGQIYDDCGNATIYLLKNGKTIGFVALWYDFGDDPYYPDRDTFITVKWRSENEYEDHRIDTVTFEGATNELERTGGIVNQIVSNYSGKTESRTRKTISVKSVMNESYTIETVNDVCEHLKEDIDKISYMVNKYPDNYNMDDIVSRLIDIETELYEIWR